MLLIVNVTIYGPNYIDNWSKLVHLHKTYGERGLKILAFPCGSIGDSVTIAKNLCLIKYQLEFKGSSISVGIVNVL